MLRSYGLKTIFRYKVSARSDSPFFFSSPPGSATRWRIGIGPTKNSAPEIGGARELLLLRHPEPSQRLPPLMRALSTSKTFCWGRRTETAFSRQAAGGINPSRPSRNRTTSELSCSTSGLTLLSCWLLCIPRIYVHVLNPLVMRPYWCDSVIKHCAKIFQGFSPDKYCHQQI